MLHVRELTSPLQAGVTYLVDSVTIRRQHFGGGGWELDGEASPAKTYRLPVLGAAHHEGAGPWHLHLDQRFMSGKMLNKFGIFLFLTESEAPPVSARPLRCLRASQEFPVRLDAVREEFRDARMTNWVCPHKGAYLGNVERVAGCVTCPMHGLTFRCDTGERVEPPETNDDLPCEPPTASAGQAGY